jgi:hypothetical protein
MKVLFDHCVRQHAVRGEYGLALFSRDNFKPRPDQEEWLQKEIACLSDIAILCREKIVVPYTTEEFEAETLRGAMFPANKKEDLFAGINFELAKSPLTRSKWGLSMDQFLNKEEVINYCKCFFLTPSPERVAKFISGMRKNPVKSLTTFEGKCLKRVQIFKAMCRGINETHYPDALHLWTAVENGLDGFLTVDKKFRNVMENQKIDLNCRIMFPTELQSSLRGIQNSIHK